VTIAGIVSTEHSRAGYPVPRIYLPSFQQCPAYVALHWHWFWTAADALHVLLPPAPGLLRSRPRPAAVEALAQALVADLLANLEGDDDRERNTDER
jgi:hypothetical protein